MGNGHQKYWEQKTFTTLFNWDTKSLDCWLFNALIMNQHKWWKIWHSEVAVWWRTDKRVVYYLVKNHLVGFALLMKNSWNQHQFIEVDEIKNSNQSHTQLPTLNRFHIFTIFCREHTYTFSIIAIWMAIYILFDFSFGWSRSFIHFIHRYDQSIS